MHAHTHTYTESNFDSESDNCEELPDGVCGKLQNVGKPHEMESGTINSDLWLSCAYQRYEVYPLQRPNAEGTTLTFTGVSVDVSAYL